MNYTYKWQSQPQVAWKGVSTNSVTPNWSAPNINGPRSSTEVDNHGYGQARLANGGVGFWGKARPIKHWRKQLNPKFPPSTPGHHRAQGRRAGIGIPMDTPQGSIYLGADSSECLTSCINSYKLKDNLAKDPALKIYNPTSSDSFLDPVTNKPVCVACNPENLIIKSGQTLLDKEYYTDSRAYLYSKGRTYRQNLGTGYRVKSGEYYDSDGNPLYPGNSLKGPPYYYHNDCVTSASCAVAPVFVYKPNNRQFATQGAVSSSTRLVKLKVDTITKNGASFKTAWGAAAANAGRYSSNGTSSYFIKSKNNNLCKPWRPSGNRTLCWVSSA